MDSLILIDPIVNILCRDYSFKDEFYQRMKEKVDANPILTWRDLKSFFDENSWSWTNLLNAKLPLVFKHLGYLCSSDIKSHSYNIQNLDNFLVFLGLLDKNTVIIDHNQLISYDESVAYKDKNQHQKTPTSTSTLDKSTKSNDIKPEALGRHNTFIPIISKIKGKFIMNNMSDWESSRYIDYYMTQYNYFKLKFSKVWQNLENRPKYPDNLKDLNINERVFLSGLISNKSQSTSQLHHSKIVLVNYDMKCQIHALLSVSKLPSVGFPLGIGIGVLGKITDIHFDEDWSTIVHITAESWYYPEFDYKTNENPILENNESWLSVFGSISGIHSTSEYAAYLEVISKWLNSKHKEFRLGFVAFLGGILPIEENKLTSISLNEHHKDDFQLNDVKGYYSIFNSFLKTIPEAMKVIIIPNKLDATSAFIPQSPISADYIEQQNNVFSFSNPSVLDLEGSISIFYNPFPFFIMDYYLTSPERLIIDLLNMHHLYPKWPGINLDLPFHPADLMLLDERIDSIICNHPLLSKFSSFRNIDIGIISGMTTTGKNENKIPILVYNIHSKAKKQFFIEITA